VVFKRAEVGEQFTYVAVAIPWLLAYVFFIAAYALRDRRMPKWLVWCGTVSFSVYLFHPVFLTIAHQVLVSPWLSFVTTVLLTLVFAHYSYKFIEAPVIRYGRKLNRRLDEPASAVAAIGRHGVLQYPTAAVASPQGSER